MGLFDNVKKKLSETAEGVINQAQNLGESMKDINLKDINLQDSLKDLSQKGADVFNDLQTGAIEMVKNVQGAFAKQEEPNELIIPEDALRMIYYVMAADGRLDGAEVSKFDEIGKDIDPKFEEHKDDLLTECAARIEKEKDPEYYIDNITDSISDAIKHSQSLSEGVIYPKLLLWNLLVISFADDEYSETEKKLLRSVLRWLNIDKSVLDEMESTIQTLYAIEKEEAWLKSTNRLFSEVEKNLNELADRRQAIMQGVQALLLD